MTPDERLRSHLADLGIEYAATPEMEARIMAEVTRPSWLSRSWWWVAPFAIVLLGAVIALAILGRPLQPVDRRAPECRYGACR